ncbi:hypothetical protein F0562_000002 [Nyssa sinensis]|uniref:F-box domain-containing protein n=1 Tax=Nyssa sinensis TaxID=561372 RepID=A0A5J5BZB7_9ASTE|nr:hypothetical protein F0562_000002 [Nyssa sinensis]
MASTKDQRNHQGNQPLENRTLPNLPQEIFVDILSRLPVKSLLQFKRVSKSWRSVISDPKFAIMHHKRALQDKDVCSQRQRLILSSDKLYSVQYKLPEDHEDNVTGVARELDCPFKYGAKEWNEKLEPQKEVFYIDGDDREAVEYEDPLTNNQNDWIDVIGSCNGSVCIAPKVDTLFIYNPTTGDSKKILDAPEILPAGMNMYGYGYDSFNDDYKVVKLVFCGALVRVYSLKANSWKTIGELACHETVYENGVHLKGAIHWVVWRRNGKDYLSVITSFDLAKETFTDIPIPVPGILDNNTKFGVGVMDGCLCVMNNRNGERDDFWVMKEYGVSESWTKFTLPNSYVCLKPLCFFKYNDDALLLIDGKLVLYNLTEKTCKNLIIRGVPFGVCFDADIYVESLLSPNRHNQVLKKVQPGTMAAVWRIMLGSQGLRVSTQGLGCMGMSANYGPPKPEPDMIALIHHAINRGVTFLDTSDAYGSNEVLLGKALKGGMREKAQLATKFGITLVDGKMEVRGDPAYVRAACEASLKRLDTDCIDLYYAHRIDTRVPIEVTMGELKKLVEEGKIKYVGLSEASASTIGRAHAVHPITAVQVEWSLWARDLEEEIVPTCRELGIRVVPYSPLGRGFFTSGSKLVENMSENDFRKKLPRFQPENLEHNKNVFERVSEMAARKGCTPSQLALAWVHHQGSDVCPIPGTTKIENLNKNIEALSIKLTREEMAELESYASADAVKGDRHVYMTTTWMNSETPPLSS